MNYWIFVATEYSDYNRGTIIDALTDLLKEGKWKIGRRTVNRNNLEAGDKIIFYMSGDNGKKFIAQAILNSKFIYKNNELWGHVKVKNINIFKNPVSIKPIIYKLNFIKNKKYWGIFFQSGIVKISEQDFKTILALSNTGELR